MSMAEPALSSEDSSVDMKHNEPALVALLDFTFTYLLRAQKKPQRVHHAPAPLAWCLVACSL
jgi:hypothetical protein